MKTPASSATVSRTRFVFQRCIETGARGGASERNLAMRSRPSSFIAARSCVGWRCRAWRQTLGDVIWREELQRSGVDALGVGSHREDEHHVGEIDRLAPRGGSDLGEGDIDEEHVTIPDQQVRGFDVSVCEPGIPQFADQVQPIVDDTVVHDRVVDLLRAFEELGDEKVFAFGCELNDAVRVRGRDPGIAHEAECVVLVLDEPAYRLKRRFVFQSSIADRAPELVPAVRAHVVHRVELSEQVDVGFAPGANERVSNRRTRPARRA